MSFAPDLDILNEADQNTWVRGGRQLWGVVMKGGEVKFEMLKDGTSVLLRELAAEDKDRSLRFFRGLSKRDRRYLRVDVTREDIVDRRIRQALSGEVVRLVALDGDEIVGDGSLEFSGDQWHRHMGEIRVIVARDFRRKRLSRILVQELFQIAQKKEIEKVVVKILSPQKSVRSICERLGFRVESVIPDYARDQEGKLHSLLIMSCTLDEWWREMRDVREERHWPDG